MNLTQIKKKMRDYEERLDGNPVHELIDASAKLEAAVLDKDYTYLKETIDKIKANIVFVNAGNFKGCADIWEKMRKLENRARCV